MFHFNLKSVRVYCHDIHTCVMYPLYELLAVFYFVVATYLSDLLLCQLHKGGPTIGFNICLQNLENLN